MQEGLFQPEINESLVFSVSEITFHLKQVLETQIEALYISGEISNFTKHSSGHLYFNLKDENSVIRCAFFRNLNYKLDFLPQDGDQVICFGKISVFEKSGMYQLIVQTLFPYGKGALQQKFEQLKLKLKTEGLFDQEHKKAIPQYPDAIGVITSPTGAALQDILNILRRRYPCRVDVFPALMQGQESPEQVIMGIKYFNATANVDLIIIARGGGSQEDLFGFNDEALARAIFQSDIPIVSAIGHEIDFTIADFVADLRAPTPSAAAELSVPDKAELQSLLEGINQKLQNQIQNRLLRLHGFLKDSKVRLWQFNPEKKLNSYQQRFDLAVSGLSVYKQAVSMLKKDLEHSQIDFISMLSNRSINIISKGKYRIDLVGERLQHATSIKLNHIRYQLELARISLEDMSPHQIMDRGYSIVTKKGKNIHSLKGLAIDDELEILLKDGTVLTGIKSISPKKNHD